ncbi:ferric reductase-like transmembrane domain-containing protein [Trebonia sp.]|uniref:ferredoxin reductase family protein n=1 Tax=Trebonia sp. TaxID=2767075 RepID=UPI00261B760D|nr:ferric reductase-like transmembrane domain-containing protein [Trebonia sp.]
MAGAIGPRGLLAAIAAGAAAVLVLWWHSTLVISGTVLGGWLTGAGEILGLLAGYAVVVLVLLMARIRPIERGVGADRLARWHAMGGRYVIGLVSGHALAITWGYAVTAHTNPVTEAGTLLTAYPDVLMATVAWFLLLGVGLVSARAVRRKLRYETWYYLHLYTYLAIALAFSHQFANGAAFVTDLAARFWWSSLYLVVAALVVWYRLVVPVRDFARHGFRVAGVRAEAPRTFSVYIQGRRLGGLDAEPGQFFRWRFLARGLWWQSHPYSLSAVPSDDLMRITVQDAGDYGAAVRSLKPGTRVIAEGPFGAFVPIRTGRSTLLLAGGVGITPLRAMFAALSGKVTLIYRASTWQDIVFQSELDAIAEARGATVHYVVGSRTDLGGDPISAQTLRELAPGVHKMDVYLCGPPGMTGSAVAALTEAGVPRRRIHFESFEFET